MVKSKSLFWLGAHVCIAFILYSNSFAHTNVTVPQAKVMIDSDPNLVVVDVRGYSEYCGSLEHIEGAWNYPWSSYFQTHYTDIPADVNVLIVCYSGTRSNLAAEYLDGKGYTYVYDMTGGMNSWVNTYGYPTVDCVDSDEDGINDDLDNCPLVYNPAQADFDDDHIGNCCDANFPLLDGYDPVDFYDLAILANNWLDTGVELAGDLDGDNTVNENDLQILTQFWLKDCDEE